MTLKLLTLLALPLGTSLLLMVAGLIAALRGARGPALALAGLATGWLYLWSTPAASDAIRASLESRTPALPAAALPVADAIVVLGGGMDPARPPQRPDPNLEAAADRVWHAARLYHAGRAPLIIASGGAMPWDDAGGPEADAIVAFLVALGVPKDAVVLEAKSTNTIENARETFALLRGRGARHLLLVTSAQHMPRSLESFRAEGFTVTPAATDFEVVPRPWTLLRVWPDAGALDDSSRAIKEWIGIARCRISGCV